MSVIEIKSSLKKLKKQAQTKKKKPRVWNEILGIIARENYAEEKKRRGVKKLPPEISAEVWSKTVKQAKDKYAVISDHHKAEREEQKIRGAKRRKDLALKRLEGETKISYDKIYSIAEEAVGSRFAKMQRENQILQTEIEKLKKEKIKLEESDQVKKEAPGITDDDDLSDMGATTPPPTALKQEQVIKVKQEPMSSFQVTPVVQTPSAIGTTRRREGGVTESKSKKKKQEGERKERSR